MVRKIGGGGSKKLYAEIKGPYLQSSIRNRIEAFFLDNIGKIATREQIIEVANEHQGSYLHN